MAKQIFINLPVKDLPKATAFYEGVGFTKNPQFSNEHAASVAWTDDIVVMLLQNEFYKTFIPGKTIPDTTKTAQMLLCLSMESKKEADDFAEAAKKHGGKVYTSSQPKETEDFMYGFNVADPDGHIWELLYMDESKMPQ